MDRLPQRVDVMFRVLAVYNVYHGGLKPLQLLRKTTNYTLCCEPSVVVCGTENHHQPVLSCKELERRALRIRKASECTLIEKHRGTIYCAAVSFPIVSYSPQLEVQPRAANANASNNKHANVITHRHYTSEFNKQLHKQSNRDNTYEMTY